MQRQAEPLLHPHNTACPLSGAHRRPTLWLLLASDASLLTLASPTLCFTCSSRVCLRFLTSLHLHSPARVHPPAPRVLPTHPYPTSFLPTPLSYLSSSVTFVTDAVALCHSLQHRASPGTHSASLVTLSHSRVMTYLVSLPTAS